MELTTHLELHSQATRLFEQAPVTAGSQAQTGLSPSMIHRPRRILPRPLLVTLSTDHNSHARKPCGDFQSELFPLHSPLLGESWLVSFPPLSYMLKSSGSSYLISGPVVKMKGLSHSRHQHNNLDRVWSIPCCLDIPLSSLHLESVANSSLRSLQTAWGYLISSEERTTTPCDELPRNISTKEGAK